LKKDSSDSSLEDDGFLDEDPMTGSQISQQHSNPPSQSSIGGTLSMKTGNNATRAVKIKCFQILWMDFFRLVFLDESFYDFSSIYLFFLGFS
jgi:hypothetical protein